ncbi:substrate-binding domain-containing protein [Streptomyces sp. NPDC001795]|uniref:sugar ABC transporter substrate-binding protein n=1 Tax=unclassified Streptomyces TaxID=2593676 RepID=UPI003324996A
MKSDAKTRMRSMTIAVSLVLAVAPGGCGGGDVASERGSFTVGVLLPSVGSSRTGQFDKPLIEKKLKELCPGCPVQSADAKDDVTVQRQQIDYMLSKGVDVLILMAVDPKALRSSVEAAHQQGVPVVAYDRLAEGPVSGYVTFDGAQVGRVQGQALLRAMGTHAHGGQIVMMNGPPTDPNAGWFKRGALPVLRGRAKIARSYDDIDWREDTAHTNMSGAIAALGGKNIDGVLAANDHLAGGVISAFKVAGITPLPPITGQDADLVGVRRIVGGEQYMTVYKPFKPEADAAATMAVALARGEKLDNLADTRVNNASTKDIPTVLLHPVPVTVSNIKDTLVKDGMYTIGQICIPELRSACDKAGLT